MKPTEVRNCMECGEWIPAERLKVEPGATRCVRCKSAAEKKGNWPSLHEKPEYLTPTRPTTRNAGTQQATARERV
jgi:RNA polymerase-binding transcription factor DksA